MAASEWERLTRARGTGRLKFIARHVIRRPVLIVGLAGLLILFNLVKDSIPLAYGLAAPALVVLIMASMGRFRTPAKDPARDEASLPTEPDGK
ncbi:hypothetical protein [Streptomyces sp. NPDC059278]|uniref:hypothetical protein n=1 Tax=Streptomyces sp. NPDC059278 TaxID=3346801 RepID=UPI0036832C57